MNPSVFFGTSSSILEQTAVAFVHLPMGYISTLVDSDSNPLGCNQVRAKEKFFFDFLQLFATCFKTLDSSTHGSNSGSNPLGCSISGSSEGKMRIGRDTEHCVLVAAKSPGQLYL